MYGRRGSRLARTKRWAIRVSMELVATPILTPTCSLPTQKAAQDITTTTASGSTTCQR